ncbi:HAD hydrolase family protein [Mycoplasmopsis caviae]|uniref:COF family HAD hydrolase protein n=1 Tax=Mycoplasmopsis caviae TaxID=55603 RepID=A0A3P8KXX5_9BACT|nr:HAD hydrolase family protein [Mycoplasmopsis caviae]VDR42557.1 COF family HAD hydrolase protein [Mycoplasmopsis caviae]
MKRNIDAYFIDLDGTLLDLPNGEETISEENVKAIVELNKSKPVVISTGRANSSFVLSLIDKLKCPYAVCQNGALIIDKNNNILAKYEIENGDVDSVVELLIKEKCS